jgi:hypothetical protein
VWTHKVPLAAEQVALPAALAGPELDRAEDAAHEDAHRAGVQREEAKGPPAGGDAGAPRARVVCVGGAGSISRSAGRGGRSKWTNTDRCRQRWQRCRVR